MPTVTTRKITRQENTEPTPRELEVVAHIAMDLSNEQIGSELGISVETVKEHVQNVIRKLKVRSRVGLALWHVKNKTTK